VVPAEPLTVKRGAATTQTLKALVLTGFHVNSDRPKDEFLIPFKLTWLSGPLETKAVSYPKPEEVKVGTQTLVVFTGSIPIKTEFKVPLDAPIGSGVMTGKLHYQACNSDMCFRPSTIEVHVPVVVE
jgi:Disulphide bond corrector protein DsbC